MPPNFFDTAVQLAGLGASGVCIFSLLCSVWLLWKSSGQKDSHAKSTVKWFMVMCLLMTVVIAVSGFMNSKLSAERIPALEEQLAAVRTSYEQLISISQIQERNLVRFRERQAEYEQNFNNTIAGVRTGIPLVKHIPLVGEATAAQLEAFLEVTTPRSVREVPYSLPNKAVTPSDSRGTL